MGAFVDIGVSVFDPSFTLDPYPYLKDLYDREDVLGFRSEGMDFLFRFEQGRAVMFNRDCTRAMGNNDELQRLEADYATRYPNRAWHFQHSYTHGDPDLRFKAAIGRFIAQVTENASFAGAETVFARLSTEHSLDDYVQDIATLPMRVFLDACRLPYTEPELEDLHRSGCAFLKSLENFHDETLIADCDKGLGCIREYMERHAPALDATSPMLDLMQAGRDCGMSEEQIIANLGGMFLTSISNTVGMSSAFILRSLLRDREAWRALCGQPQLAADEHTIMELLRRDNHVKALSRQFNTGMELDGFDILAGQVVYLYFPGINMDHNHWRDPERLDFARRFTGENNIIFGGSFYACIGRRLTMAFLGNMLEGFLRHLPQTAAIDDAQTEADGSWLAERVITRLPIQLAAR
jgi:cytochrome P450